jgi:deoxyribonuclease V
MIACVDVHYRPEYATAACVTFDDWTASAPASEHVARIDQVDDYVPGEFYRRELPCIMAVIEPILDRLDVIVVDGYVWLGENRPGLGARLYDTLGGKIPVVGVAKAPFAGALAEEVLRGNATRPLYVTSIGIDPVDAADHIRRMHGPYRLPTLLKRVDALCRGTG